MTQASMRQARPSRVSVAYDKGFAAGEAGRILGIWDCGGDATAEERNAWRQGFMVGQTLRRPVRTAHH